MSQRVMVSPSRPARARAALARNRSTWLGRYPGAPRSKFRVSTSAGVRGRPVDGTCAANGALGRGGGACGAADGGIEGGGKKPSSAPAGARWAGGGGGGEVGGAADGGIVGGGKSPSSAAGAC